MDKKEEPIKQKDLAILPRAQLIKGGFEALSKKNFKDAQYYFGAAIRKAKRVQLWDVEAEFYKFVALYFEGNYNEAVKRCLECLDAVKLTSDEAIKDGHILPTDVIESTLSDALIQTMVIRRDTFWQLINHFWQKSKGEYYLSKKSYSLVEAMMKAWMAFSIETKISYNMLKNEFKPFTAFLQEQLNTADEMQKGSEEKVTAPSQELTSADSKPPQPSMEEIENEFAANLRKYSELTLMRLSNTDIEELLKICRVTRSVSNISEIAKLTDMLGPNSKKVYIEALSQNELLIQKEKKLSEHLAERLRQEVLEFLEKREGI